MAKFIVTTDGKTYLNLDHAKYIRQVTIIGDIALIVLEDNCEVYQVPAVDWLRHASTFETRDVAVKTSDNHLAEHRGSPDEVGLTRKAHNVKTRKPKQHK